jgi:anti-sigma factor (TIGR02949 family)
VASIDRYTCEDVFRRLEAYLDRELAADEMRRVSEHLETCAQCAHEHRFERRMLDEVKNRIRRVDAPADLRARVAAALERARREP